MVASERVISSCTSGQISSPSFSTRPVCNGVCGTAVYCCKKISRYFYELLCHFVGKLVVERWAHKLQTMNEQKKHTQRRKNFTRKIDLGKIWILLHTFCKLHKILYNIYEAYKSETFFRIPSLSLSLSLNGRRSNKEQKMP